MTTTNGWPGKPGVPRDPGLPGAHWLKRDTEDVWMYDGNGGWWGPGYSHKLHAETVGARYSYLGPCLTPDEAAKREDVKWHQGYAVGVLDVRRGTAFGEPDTHYAALQKRCEEAERERDALRRDASQEIATDEMVRRLQHLGDWQAADRIEALQKRVAELEDFCEDYLVRFELFHITNTQDAPEDATGFLAEKARAILGAALTGGKDE